MSDKKRTGKEAKNYNNRKNVMSVYKITLCGLMTALAMVFSYIENLIPIPIPVYGIKLGVANIAIIGMLYSIGWKEALIVNVLRITLTAMMFGNLNSFLFSIAGGMLSILVMIILKSLNIFSQIAVSIAGGVSHNIGQIIAAMLIMETPVIIYYLPVLMIAGIIAGVITGIVGKILSDTITKTINK